MRPTCPSGSSHVAEAARRSGRWNTAKKAVAFGTALGKKVAHLTPREGEQAAGAGAARNPLARGGSDRDVTAESSCSLEA